MTLYTYIHALIFFFFPFFIGFLILFFFFGFSLNSTPDGRFCRPAFFTYFLTRRRDSLFIYLMKFWFLEKRLEVATYLFNFFKRKNKIRKKNPKCDSWIKNKFVKNRVYKMATQSLFQKIKISPNEWKASLAIKWGRTWKT